MKISKVKILDIYGVKNIVLDGDYTKEELIENLVEYWIPYIDCDRKCFRADSCLFSQKYPDNPYRLTDMQCDAAVKALTVFINNTYLILKKSDPSLHSAYFDGLYYYTKFILDAENAIGKVLDEAAIQSYGNLAPFALSRIIDLRENLNVLAECLQYFPEFRSKRSVLFVEGETEKVFLERMKDSHDLSFLHLNIIEYGGSGNKKSKRIQMLLDDYIKKGYSIYFQGDADGGQASDVFKDLIRKNSVNINNTFVFKKDFESAIPANIFVYIMNELNLIDPKNQFYIFKKLQGEDISFVQNMKNNFNIDINPYKKNISESFADFLINKFRNWSRDKKFMETEFGSFLKFIKDIK